MAYDEKLALRVRSNLGRYRAVREVKMFGGLAFMLRGRMCLGVLGDGLIVRVGRDGQQWALAQPHCRPMVFHLRTVSGFVYVAPEGYRSGAGLAKWMRRGVEFASALGSAPKKRKNRARRNRSQR